MVSRETKELYQFFENLSRKEIFLRLMLCKLQAPEQSSIVAVLTREKSFAYEDLERMLIQYNITTDNMGDADDKPERPSRQRKPQVMRE
ncbi:hypothetical protein V1511DRAFT_513750, partial [Dipodascopsis uninucleata]